MFLALKNVNYKDVSINRTRKGETTHPDEEASRDVQDEFSHEVCWVAPVVPQVALKELLGLEQPRRSEFCLKSNLHSALASSFGVNCFDLPLYVLCFRGVFPNSVPILVSRRTCTSSDNIQDEFRADGKVSYVFKFW